MVLDAAFPLFFPWAYSLSLGM